MSLGDRSHNPRRPPGVVLLYDADAYEERPAPAGRPGPLGLMGRQVAGRSFLDAYLALGSFSELGALVTGDAAAQSLIKAWRSHSTNQSGGRTLRITGLDALPTAFASVGASILHAPQPLDSAFAWARRRLAPGVFALSGITHTLASPRAIELLRGLVDAPFEPYDALICTSRAVAEMVRAVTGEYAGFLRDRFQGTGQVNTPVHLEVIPLGVDTERFRPPTADQRLEGRGHLGVNEDEVAILFVGRLSHHAKAHPFAMFRAASLAAERTGRSLHLLVAGWTANDTVRTAFAEGARAFASGVRVSFLDGTDPVVRQKVWHSADVFVTLADSIQETFGLTVVEALASGLPVVASDWDGYRDLVEDGVNGFLIQTTSVRGATSDATARLLCGALNYDQYLAECSQAIAVDVPTAAAAIAWLATDDARRAAMGASGRARALNRFQWPRIIREYERLWTEQEAERSARTPPAPAGPEAYPAPERSFSAYPSTWLDADDLVEPVGGAALALGVLLAMPLTNHAPARRAADPAVIQAALSAAPCPIAAIDAVWSAAGVEFGLGRATLAWMLKYDLIRFTSRVGQDQGTFGEGPL